MKMAAHSCQMAALLCVQHVAAGREGRELAPRREAVFLNLNIIISACIFESLIYTTSPITLEPLQLCVQLVPSSMSAPTQQPQTNSQGPAPAATGSSAPNSNGGSGGTGGGCPPHVLEAIYGKSQNKKVAYEASLQRWWTGELQASYSAS